MPFDIFYDVRKPEAPYCVNGPDCQIVTLMLNPGQKLAAEPGAMMYMSPGTKTSVECGSCSRVLTGESCCKTIYTNQTSNQGYIALTPHFPAKVIPLNLPEYGGKIIAKRGMYMASVGDVSVTANFDCTCCVSAFGGLGSIRQAMTGDGTVFLAAGGTVLTKVLKEGEVNINIHLFHFTLFSSSFKTMPLIVFVCVLTIVFTIPLIAIVQQIVVDSESVVGFQDSVKLGLRCAGIFIFYELSCSVCDDG